MSLLEKGKKTPEQRKVSVSDKREEKNRQKIIMAYSAFYI